MLLNNSGRKIVTRVSVDVPVCNVDVVNECVRERESAAGKYECECGA